MYHSTLAHVVVSNNISVTTPSNDVTTSLGVLRSKHAFLPLAVLSLYLHYYLWRSPGYEFHSVLLRS